MRFFIVAIMAMALTGCGPEQSARDSETKEMESIVAKQKAELENLEGVYTGTAKTWDGSKTYRLRLFINQFSTLVPSTNRYDMIEIPNLVAFMQIVGESDHAMLRGFTQGRYSSREQILQLYGGPVGLIPFNFLKVQSTRNGLVGELWSGNIISPVEFRKAN